MHIETSPRGSSQPDHPTIKLVLREAKRLHRAATSESLAASLPILRRLLSMQVLERISLPELSRNRSMVQRKHVLRMLAIEAGHPSWEAYRRVLADMSPDMLAHFDLVRQRVGYPNRWFASADEAEAYAARHGGRALRVGDQAVVLPESSPAAPVA